MPASGRHVVGMSRVRLSTVVGGTCFLEEGTLTLCTVHRMALAIAILSFTAPSAHAQGMGSIFGKATDASGAVMPGVTVTATGPSIQQPRVTVTGAGGTYQMPNGRYR